MSERVRHVYLDNNATTPCDEAVLAAMLPYFRQQYANPSSPHAMGKQARAAVSNSRESLAGLLHCQESEIIFTSGATESNNMVLLGATSPNPVRQNVSTSPIEHKSVLMPCHVKEKQGFKIRQFSVSSTGVVDLNSVEEQITDDTAIVSLQAANNETGVIQPVQEVADIAHSRGALFHCDATQWIAKLPIPAWFQSCDYLSLSAHKCYGPKGVGVLVARQGMPRRSLAPLIHGGQQELGLRSGTANVPGIVGFGVACNLAMECAEKDEVSMGKMRERFENAIAKSLPNAWINGNSENRLPGTTSLTIPDVPASMLVLRLADICIGEGSACTTGAPEPSHVLIAMGLSREHADSTVRISFGRQNTIEDADMAALSIAKAVTSILEDLCVASSQTVLTSSGGNDGS